VLLSNRGFPDLEARAELAEDRLRTLEDANAALKAELDTTRETLESTQVRGMLPLLPACSGTAPHPVFHHHARHRRTS